MGECYADTVEFNDPVFKGLKGNAARAMWQMLIERGAELKLTYSNIKANDTEGSADWVAVYPFSKTGKNSHQSYSRKVPIQRRKDCKPQRSIQFMEMGRHGTWNNWLSNGFYAIYPKPN